MPPTHIFADVVAWLHFYDLEALLLTEARCADLASSAASKIRVFDFSEFRFDLHTTEIVVYNLAQPASRPTILEFHGKADLIEFVPDALRNCILGNLDLAFKDSSDAIMEVAHLIIIKGTLFLNADIFVNETALVDFAVSLRSVQRVYVTTARTFDDSWIEEFAVLFGYHDFGPEIWNRHWVSFVNRST